MDPILAVVVVALMSLCCMVGLIALILRVTPRDACDTREGDVRESDAIRCRNCLEIVGFKADGPLPDGFECPMCGCDPNIDRKTSPMECAVCGFRCRQDDAPDGECPRCGCLASVVAAE